MVRKLLRPRALFLMPSRELAVQALVRTLPPPVLLSFPHTPSQHTAKALAREAKLRVTALIPGASAANTIDHDILIATPGRLQQAQASGAVVLSAVEYACM